MDAQPFVFPSAIDIDVAKGHCDVKFPDHSGTVAFQFDDAGFTSLLERLVRFRSTPFGHLPRRRVFLCAPPVRAAFSSACSVELLRPNNRS
jgi:hypothetical protein